MHRIILILLLGAFLTPTYAQTPPINTTATAATTDFGLLIKGSYTPPDIATPSTIAPSVGNILLMFNTTLYSTDMENFPYPWMQSVNCNCIFNYYTFSIEHLLLV